MAREIEQTAITIEDCLDMFEKKSMIAIIDNGKVIDFVKEK